MKNDIIIIGGGIVGLALAWRITEKNPALKILILEKERDIALHQTGNNSGVIHSGIYYRPGSLKAENCLRGYSMLLDFARENDIPFELCGKLIVATSEKELAPMEDLYQRGLQNGLKKIRKLSAGEVKEMEPHITALAGIHVPQTGIIDYRKVCNILRKKIEDAGSVVLTEEQVTGIDQGRLQTKVITTKNSYNTKLLVNTAGLQSDRIAALNLTKIPFRIIPFRGEYYKLGEEKKHLINNLVYPVPDPDFPFLGVHFTRKTDGNIEAGPNAVFSFKREGYNKTSFSFKDSIDSFFWPGFQKLIFRHMKMGLTEFYRSYNKNAFTRSLQKLMPEIKSSDLVPGGAGVRAQACDRKGNLIDDFLILEDKHIINIINAPSPAATAALSIGETIAQKIIQKIM